MVLQTIDGSVALMRTSGKHSAELKNQVTSPGGTTAAGLVRTRESKCAGNDQQRDVLPPTGAARMGAMSEKKDNA